MPTPNEPDAQPGSEADALDEGERGQIRARLEMTPRERLLALLEMLAFEERARRARVVRRLVG